MKILIVEDDLICGKIMTGHLSPYGKCDLTIDGQSAIQLFKNAWKNNQPYDLITIDIMLPNIDGQETLQQIRKLELTMGIQDSKKAKVIMTTALGNPKNVIEAFYKGGAMAYIVKPIEKEKLLEEIKKSGLKLGS
jgi:two-component system, chemotaxis family, chemotaxis protein CheY